MYLSAYDNAPDGKGIIKRIENCRLTGGKILDLSRLYMTELPDEVRGFENLTELDVSYNQLHTLPDWLGGFHSLKKLNLRGNEINALPDSTGELKGLSFLDIGINSFIEIPEFIGKLQNLTELALGHSGEWEEESYKRMTNDLDRQINELDKLPAFLSSLPKLKRLDLGYTALKSLPEDLRSLRLEYLNLANNKLTAIPEWLGEMTSLRELNLCGNA